MGRERKGSRQGGWIAILLTGGGCPTETKMVGERVGAGLQVSGRLTVRAKEQKVLRRSVSGECQEQQGATVFGGRGETARTQT